MRKYKSSGMYFLATLLIAFMIGCGQEIVNVPTVVSTIPTSGATGVAVNTPISATFSMAMKPASITAATFTVTGPGGAAVAGAVTYSGLTATFTPAANLATTTLYTATITTGATNLGGTPLRANYVWTFTTGDAAALPAPTVTGSIPANGATAVPVGQALSATFSLAMNPATINTATFTLKGPGNAPVAGAVTYTGLVATFTPTIPLGYSSVYTATITTGAADVAGTSLAADYVWTFTTAASTVVLPAPTVTATVPLNAATGVPLGQVITATFSEAMNCATLASPAINFTISGPGVTAVAGAVSCTGTVATFTPATSLKINTVYTATITTAAQDAAGIGLAANYVWTFRTVPAPTAPTVISTIPANLATAVPINQALSATFSVAMTPATIDSSTFTVSGPGGPVAGVVTYVAAGSVATFTPTANLASSTLYTATITTGAQDLEGTALAQNFVWTFTTAAAPIVTPPTVISTIPLNAATGVPFNQAVSATFSKAMNPATISSATFALTGPGTNAVLGLVAYAAIGNTVTFTPTANLAPNTLYTATITTGVQDLAGDAMASNYVWTFTTGAAPDVIPPQLVSTIPLNGAANVPPTQTVSATFTEAMDPLTITTATFQLTQGGALVPATVTYDAVNFIATLTPTAPLTISTAYTATGNYGSNRSGRESSRQHRRSESLDVHHCGCSDSAADRSGTNCGALWRVRRQRRHDEQWHQHDYPWGYRVHCRLFIDDRIPRRQCRGCGVDECTYSEDPLSIGLVTGGTINTAPGTSQPTAACPMKGPAVTLPSHRRRHWRRKRPTTRSQPFPTAWMFQSALDAEAGNAGELGNRTLAPGVYKSAVQSFGITMGDLTLDAQGDPNAFWIFQMGTSLTIGTSSSPRSILLTNGALAKNVYWQVGSDATINGILGGGVIQGTIISQASIAVSTAGVTALTTINGRLLALNASVTLVNTVINTPVQ